jgi:3-methyl-2-oxobutanoate hydroxymethyltransferase
MYGELKPKFVKRYAELGDQVVHATQRYADEVRRGVFPSAQESFGSSPAAASDTTGAAPVVEPVAAGYGPASEEGA